MTDASGNGCTTRRNDGEMAPKVDPKLLEREFVTGDESIRTLAERHGISWSALATRARKQDAEGLTWYEKREAFKRSVSAKSFDKTAEKFAIEDATIREELVLVHRATIRAYANALREGRVVITPKDAVNATSSLLLLIGEATSRTETQIVDGNAGHIPIEDLRKLAEFARSKLIEPGPMATDTQPEPARTRPN